MPQNELSEGQTKPKAYVIFFKMVIYFANKTHQITHAPCKKAAEGSAHLFKIVGTGNITLM